MVNKNFYAVIMAGGVGTRLWPFSRTNYPKQFHDILGTGKSLLQQTIARFEDVCPTENIYIVSNELYRDQIKEQLPQLRDEQILLEPIKRNTAPCIAYACYKIVEQNPEATMVVAPADQVILQEDDFARIVRDTMEAASKEDVLVSLGINPSRPDTGYGYIKYDKNDPNLLKKVEEFKEKPPLELAQQYLDSGEYVWNAGIFVWNVQSIIQAFTEHMPELHQIFHEARTKLNGSEEQETVGQVYTNCMSESIDIGVMEKAQNVHVVLCDFDWSDLGTWKSLYENSEKDAQGNVISGQIINHDTQNCIIKMPNDKLVVVQGMDNFIVAEFDNVLLICRKDEEQRVKSFVKEAKEVNEKYV